MGAPLGNQNAVKTKLFEQALRREIKQRDLTDGDGETLRKIAAQWIDKAIAGDPALGKEVRDTLDGKPQQAIAVSGELALRKAAELSDDELAAIANASGTAQT